MKRIVAAFVIVLLIGGLTFGGNYAMNKLITGLENQLTEIIVIAQQQNEQLASKKIDDFAAVFKKKRHLLELFVKRDYVLSLNTSIEGMRAYPTADTWNDLESEAEKAYEQLSSIKHLFFSVI